MESNVFKSKKDEECRQITKKCVQISFCEKDKHNNISKFYTSEDVLKWELRVYMTLEKWNIVPKIKSGNLQVTYGTNDLVSLRTMLTRHTIEEYTVFLYELFSFINSFKQLQFVHGNLHIDNIFVEQENQLNFYVIDFANSYLFNSKVSQPQYNRSSYIGEYNNKLKAYHLIYWDFFTMYISLLQVIGKDKKLKTILDSIVKTYIKKETMYALLSLVVKRN
jgi:hypothetical protein